MKRCDWAIGNELDTLYHDTEWGKPVHDDKKLFEMLVLESMQAGLNWSTILKKRDSLTKAFDNWDYKKIARYDDQKFEELLHNPGIIRHKLKIKAAINNANCFLAIQNEWGSFDQFIWQFVNHQPIINNWSTISEVPSSTELSDTISKALKKNGFKFIGTTTIYAYMQATGLVNDHLDDCAFK